MKRAVVAAAAGIVLTASVAAAEVSGQADPFMREPAKQTVYATDQHMGFSMRSSVIHWLGGVTLVEPSELRDAERDRWWGRDVPLVPAEGRRAIR